MKLRFIERIATEGPHEGSLQRVLQVREGSMYPWTDVPCYTLAQQAQELEERTADADVRDYE